MVFAQQLLVVEGLLQMIPGEDEQAAAVLEIGGEGIQGGGSKIGDIGKNYRIVFIEVGGGEVGGGNGPRFDKRLIAGGRWVDGAEEALQVEDFTLLRRKAGVA